MLRAAVVVVAAAAAAKADARGGRGGGGERGRRRGAPNRRFGEGAATSAPDYTLRNDGDGGRGGAERRGGMVRFGTVCRSRTLLGVHHEELRDPVMRVEQLHALWGLGSGAQPDGVASPARAEGHFVSEKVKTRGACRAYPPRFLFPSSSLFRPSPGAVVHTRCGCCPARINLPTTSSQV